MSSECFDYQPDISALLDGALTAEEAAALEEHLEGCLVCQAEKAELEQVAAQVRGLPRLSVPAHFAAGVMARVIEEPAAVAEVPVAKLVAPEPDAPSLVFDEQPAAAGEAPAAPSDCARLAEDRSALLDNALDREQAIRVKEHLVECEACHADQLGLQRLRDRVGALPRMRVPPDFVQQVMDGVDAIEFTRMREEKQRREARAKSLQTLSWLAQAASFLLILTGGIYFTTPDAPRSPFQNVSHKVRHRPVDVDRPKAAQRIKDVVPPETKLPPGDAQWELSVASLEQGHQVTRTFATQLTRLRVERGVNTTDQRTSGFLVDVARNRIDDLHARLDADQTVQTNPRSLEETERLHTEQDQVELKSGFVLVGKLLRNDRRGVQIMAGGARRELDRKDVVRIESAGETKTLRILLHERD